MYEAKDVKVGTYEREPEEAARFGLLPGEESKGRFAARWDPREDFEESADLGWIGEDKGGVWIRRHPNVAFMEFPKIWAIVDEFRFGSQEITPTEYESRSAYEMEARVVMSSAWARKMKRDIGRG